MASTQANGKSAAKANGASKAGGAKSDSKQAAPTKTVGRSNGASTPADISSLEPLTVWSTSSKPDRETYNREQEAIKAILEAKTAQLNKVKQRIADSTGQGPVGERRKALRAEQGELRQKTAGFKDERNAALNQIKALQEGVQKKIKDMQNAKSKTSYKSVAEIDNRIKDLEKQVESGSMRLVDEKRALSEISDLRRSKKSFDSFGTQQESIDADKAKMDELRSKLDNPEYKALQDRYTEIQKELDGVNKEMDESNASRDKLFEERNKLNEEVNALWNRKKESAAGFKEANDKYFTRVNEERQKRIERQQTERRQYEESKRREINDRLLEEAKAPAFEREIEDCNTLISYFNRLSGGATGVPEPKLATVGGDSADGPANVPKLELRQVENDIPQGAIISKKAQQSTDDDLFGGMKGGRGKKGKKAAEQAPATSASQMPTIPFQTVAALLQLNISAPLSRDDNPKTIDSLKEKKSWFEANQDRVTKERTAAAEARIAEAEQKAQAATQGASSAATESAATPAKAAEDDATADAPEPPTEGISRLAVEEEEKEEGEIDS